MINRLRPILIALPLALVLAGCDPAPETEPAPVQADDDREPTLAEPLPASEPGASGETDEDSVNDGNPDLTPAPLVPEAERSETGARNVLIAFARAIELEEWDQAWAMMGDADRARWSRGAFAALFSDLDEVTVAVPGGTMEGAAGSSYYTAPTTITGTDPDGRPVRYEGEIVLKRVNDVPGATAEQLRWRIERVDLDWTH